MNSTGHRGRPSPKDVFPLSIRKKGALAFRFLRQTFPNAQYSVSRWEMDCSGKAVLTSDEKKHDAALITR
jgi:hypothetical protein